MSGLKKMRALGVFVLVTALFLPLALGGSVKLKDGRSLQGKIVSMDEDSVVLLTSSGRVVLKRSQLIEPDTEKLLEKARIALDHSDFVGVVKYSGQILAWDPDHAEAIDLNNQAENFVRLFGSRNAIAEKIPPPKTARNNPGSSKNSGQEAVTGAALKGSSREEPLDALLLSIMRKLMDVRSYSYVEEVIRRSGLQDGIVVETRHREERSFKRPNYFSGKLVRTKSHDSNLMGKTVLSKMDGSNLWQYFPTSDDPENPPLLYKWDMTQLRRTGFRAENIVQAGKMLNPFGVCDVSTIKLQEQNDTSWVFIARPNRSMQVQGLSKIRLTIDKKDSIARKIEWISSDPNIGDTYLITDVRLDPDLSDKEFEFSPPTGVKINDRTPAILAKRAEEK